MQSVERDGRSGVGAAVRVAHRAPLPPRPAHRAAGEHHQLGVLGVELSHRRSSCLTASVGLTSTVPIRTRPRWSRPALGAQLQPVPRHLGARQRHAAQLEGQQAADGVDVEILVELDVVQLAEVLDRQPGRHPEVLVAQVFHRRDLVGVVLVGDLADDLLEHVLDGDQARDRAVFVDQQRHVVAVALHLAQQRVQRLGVRHEHRRAHHLADTLVSRPPLFE